MRRHLADLEEKHELRSDMMHVEGAGYMAITA
jgi:hypothetical protein